MKSLADEFVSEYHERNPALFTKMTGTARSVETTDESRRDLIAGIENFAGTVNGEPSTVNGGHSRSAFTALGTEPRTTNEERRTPIHDRDGNLTSARLDPQGPAGLYGGSGVSTATLAYDSRNRLLSVAKGGDSVAQTYDTRNRVTSRTVNGQTTYFVWDGWELIEERDENGDLFRRYVHGAGIDEPLMRVDTEGPLYYVQDGLGSVTALTDENGAVVESYRYDVFGTVSAFDGNGDPLAGGPATGNRFLYTGREWIAEAGLYDYRNRVYSSVLGRFLQNDPIRFTAGDVNLYRYVGNSVVEFVDPWGLEVMIKSRPVKRSVRAGAHTWVEVKDSNGERTTYSGTKEKTEDGSKLGIKKNHEPDLNPTKRYPETSSVTIPPPEGMTQDEWDQAVKDAAERLIDRLDEKRDYKALAGDGGKESGNCHTVTGEIMEEAGGKVPSDYNPPGWNPGLNE